jgi:hypothetical protein
MNTEPIEPVEFDRTIWKTDPNAYARNYFHLKKNNIIHCSCGKDLKQSAYYKHQKSKNHQVGLLELENKKLKEDLGIKGYKE